NVTLYTPGRRSMILYCPWPSVTADRERSISAGLDASTVTPGSTAPEESRTTPAIAVCPWAKRSREQRRTAAVRTRRTNTRVRSPMMPPEVKLQSEVAGVYRQSQREVKPQAGALNPA